MMTKTCKLLALLALLPFIAVVSPANAAVNPTADAAGIEQSQSDGKQMQLTRGQNRLPAQKGESSC